MFNYDNIGEKIKGLAKASFVVEAIGAVITGLVFIIEEGVEDAWWALLIILFGPLVAWVGSWILYGFGEIVDKVAKIEYNTSLVYKSSELKKASSKVENQLIEEEKKNALRAKAIKDAADRQRKEEQQRREEERIKRELEKKTIAEIEENRRISQELDNELVDVICPECDEVLSFAPGTKSAECPNCGCAIKLNI